MSDDTGGEATARLRAAVRRVAHEMDLGLVVLFGSAARGEAPSRDLDLAVLGTGTLDLVDVTNRLAVLLGRNDVDVANLRRADPLLAMLVARDGVPLFEREPAAFASFCSLAARRFADTRKFREAEREEIRDFIARRAEPR